MSEQKSERLAALARELLALAAGARHGPDFSSVTWNGVYYTFSAAQAAVVEILWRAWENGTPDVRQDTLADAVGTDTKRMAHLFRDHPAWNVMIVAGPARGLFRLAGPENASAHSSHT